MKSIIKTKIYDTKKAIKIFSAEKDGKNFWKELYKTPKGNYFVVNEGEFITPITNYEVILWFEEAGQVELLIEHFNARLTEA